MKKTAIGQTLLIAMLLATSAEARGPNQPIRILPISQATAGAPSNIALAIEDDDIEEIDIATFMVVEERFKTATEFTGATVLDSRQAANAAICARPLPGTACVRRGDTLSLPWPHAVSLAPGLYAELVVVTVIIRGRDEPVDIADYRYFEITADGLFPISGDESESSPHFLGGCVGVEEQDLPEEFVVA